MEIPSAPPERRLTGLKQLDRPAALRLGNFSRVLLVPHSDPMQGVLVLSQDRLLSKWGASRQMKDFSIGRPEGEIVNDIEFRDNVVSPNHIRVSRGSSGSYSVEDQKSKNGTFEEEVKEINGEGSVGNNEWVLTSLPEHPTLQIGNVLVRIEKTGDKIYLVSGKRRIEIVEGMPFTIGAGADNNLSIGKTEGNPFDRVTLVCFDENVLVNSSDKTIAIKEEDPGAPTQLQEAAWRHVLLEQALEEEKNKTIAAEQQVAAKDIENAELQQRMKTLEKQNLELARRRSEADTRIRQLEGEVGRLRSSSGGRDRASGTFGQLDGILRGLDPEQHREILHALRRSFAKQLHPDTNPDADQRALKRANNILDDLLSELRRRGHRPL